MRQYTRILFINVLYCTFLDICLFISDSSMRKDNEFVTPILFTDSRTYRLYGVRNGLWMDCFY